MEEQETSGDPHNIKDDFPSLPTAPGGPRRVQAGIPEISVVPVVIEDVVVHN
jgi:hypothetical protein